MPLHVHSLVTFSASLCFTYKEYEHARNRGAKIYAEVRGYGLSGDSNHMTAPPATGDGARRAMQSAISQSGLALHDIGYINAHATSTPLGDRAENTAVKELFGEYANELGISSTKVRGSCTPLNRSCPHLSRLCKRFCITCLRELSATC